MLPVPAAMPESPPTRQRALPRSTTGAGSEPRRSGTPKKRALAPAPAIEVPRGAGRDDGDGGGSSSSGGQQRHVYTSLRDIMSSPQAPPPCVDGDAHLIRNPLLRRAAYAYMRLTPSGWEDPRRRGRGWRGALCRLLFSCHSFFEALFRSS